MTLRTTVVMLALALVANAADVSKLEQAARRGDCGAMIELAAMYYRGEGVPKNARKAYIWGTIYMNSFPDYTRGIAKITGWAEDELSPAQLRDANAEIEKLTKEIDQAKGRAKPAPDNRTENKTGRARCHILDVS